MYFVQFTIKGATITIQFADMASVVDWLEDFAGPKGYDCRVYPK